MKLLFYKFKRLPFISLILVAINIVIYILCAFGWDMLYNRGSHGVVQVLVNKEYGRIIWSMFLHGDVSHLFNNMLILCFLGAMIEEEIGHIRFSIFYFLSGIGGNLLSFAVKYMTNDLSGSIGASGAVFGLDGVLLALVLFSNRRLTTVTPGRVLFMIGYSLYSGLTGQNIDNAAHIGGLLVGFILGTFMCIIEKRRNRLEY